MRDIDKGEEAWMDHLSKYGLLNLHHEALEVGYRIRVANGVTFDLEYQGGLAKYSQPPLWLQTFTDDPVGRNAARNFLIWGSQIISRIDGIRTSRTARWKQRISWQISQKI